MKKILSIILLLVLLFNVSISIASNKDTSQVTYNFVELTFEEYQQTENTDILVLNIKNNHKVAISFNFHIDSDDISEYKKATYKYDIINDILVITSIDGVTIYSDNEL